MKTTEIAEFEESIKTDSDGWHKCPKCDFEDNRDKWFITEHFEMEHEN